jgi:hypothetical protein
MMSSPPHGCQLAQHTIDHLQNTTTPISWPKTAKTGKDSRGKKMNTSRGLKISLILVVICLCSVPVQAKYSGGTGDPWDPYLISDANDMNEIGRDSNDWDKDFVMTADVNLAQFTGTQFNIIGNGTTKFTGVFDGDGHTISNFTYTSTLTDYISVFGYVGSGGEIMDLGIVDANIDAGSGDCAGGLVGYNYYGIITRCYATGDVNGGTYVGGLLGLSGGPITSCYATAAVNGGDFVGGLMGYNILLSNITSCYATGDVNGNDWIGGLVGSNWGDITNCYATGDVRAISQAAMRRGMLTVVPMSAGWWDLMKVLLVLPISQAAMRRGLLQEVPMSAAWWDQIVRRFWPLSGISGQVVLTTASELAFQLNR